LAYWRCGVTATPNNEYEASLDVEDRFAIVPEWLLDAEISDAAVRLYAVLLRFGQSSGARMPSRSTLARRLRKRSTDTVDRAMRELVELGSVVVENRFDGGQRLTNRYLVRTSRPRGGDVGGGRKNAATPIRAATPTSAATHTDAATGIVAPRGGRMDAARVAANLRHNPEFLTQSETPPPPAVTPPADASADVATSWEEVADRLKAECGIGDWDAFVADCQRLRGAVGQPVGRWSSQCLLAALQLAVRGRGWPATRAAAALLLVAADPATRSPMRLAEAGPWWDEPTTNARLSDDVVVELAAMEAELADSGGLRILLQRQARDQLAAEGVPATRTTVTRRAFELLQGRRDSAGAAAC
jgi:hypothetical protein